MEKVFGLFTPEEVVSFIKTRAPSLSEKVLEVFIAENIDGEVFLELNDEQLREVVPLFGDRLKIKLAIKAARSSSVSHALQIVCELFSFATNFTSPQAAATCQAAAAVPPLHQLLSPAVQ